MLQQHDHRHTITGPDWVIALRAARINRAAHLATLRTFVRDATGHGLTRYPAPVDTAPKATPLRRY